MAPASLSARPSVFPSEVDTVEETRCAEICFAAGVRFAGIQKAFPEHNLETLVLFADKNDGSCLAIRLSDLSIEAIQAKLTKAARLWAKL